MVRNSSERPNGISINKEGVGRAMRCVEVWTGNEAMSSWKGRVSSFWQHRVMGDDLLRVTSQRGGPAREVRVSFVPTRPYFQDVAAIATPSFLRSHCPQWLVVMCTVPAIGISSAGITLILERF